jgi:hypothetical protein
MDLLGVLVFFLVVFLVAYLAHYVIETFLPEPIRMVCKIVVGVILLIVIVQFLVGGVNWPRGPVFHWGPK